MLNEAEGYLKTKDEINSVLLKAKDLNLYSAFSYLNSELNSAETLCSDCLDQLLIDYRSNPQKVDSDYYFEAYMRCKLLSEHQNDSDDFT
nr:hypothetical protein A132_10070 [Vibrio kanaloae 5S-149]